MLVRPVGQTSRHYYSSLIKKSFLLRLELTYFRTKSHVEHAVSFVQNEVLEIVECDTPLLHKVEEPEKVNMTYKQLYRKQR